MNILELKESLKHLYWDCEKTPVSFDFVNFITKYVNLIQTSPVLLEMIKKEQQDLGDTVAKLPKATNNIEYDIMMKILREKRYTNIYEEYVELTWIKDALYNYKTKKSEYEMIKHEIMMVNDLDLLKNGNIKKTWKNYYYYSELLKKLNKVHNHLIIELDKQIELNKDIKPKEIIFNKETGVLFINEIAIKIKAQKRITNEYRIINYIFSQPNLNDDFFYTEIAEGILDQNYKLSTYTTACEKIQNKIFKKTGNNDFLLFNYSKNQGMVRINPKYLKK